MPYDQNPQEREKSFNQKLESYKSAYCKLHSKFNCSCFLVEFKGLLKCFVAVQKFAFPKNKITDSQQQIKYVGLVWG